MKHRLCCMIFASMRCFQEPELQVPVSWSDFASPRNFCSLSILALLTNHLTFRYCLVPQHACVQLMFQKTGCCSNTTPLILSLPPLQKVPRKAFKAFSNPTELCGLIENARELYDHQQLNMLLVDRLRLCFEADAATSGQLKPLPNIRPDRGLSVW